MNNINIDHFSDKQTSSSLPLPASLMSLPSSSLSSSSPMPLSPASLSTSHSFRCYLEMLSLITYAFRIHFFSQWRAPNQCTIMSFLNIHNQVRSITVTNSSWRGVVRVSRWSTDLARDRVGIYNCLGALVQLTWLWRLNGIVTTCTGLVDRYHRDWGSSELTWWSLTTWVLRVYLKCAFIW